MPSFSISAYSGLPTFSFSPVGTVGTHPARGFTPASPRTARPGKHSAAPRKSACSALRGRRDWSIQGPGKAANPAATNSSSSPFRDCSSSSRAEATYCASPPGSCASSSSACVLPPALHRSCRVPHAARVGALLPRAAPGTIPAPPATPSAPCLSPPGDAPGLRTKG